MSRRNFKVGEYYFIVALDPVPRGMIAERADVPVGSIVRIDARSMTDVFVSIPPSTETIRPSVSKKRLGERIDPHVARMLYGGEG